MSSNPRLLSLAIFASIFMMGTSLTAAGTIEDDPLAGLPDKVASQVKSKLPGVVLKRDDTVAALSKPEDWLPLSQAFFVFDRPQDTGKSTRWTITPAKRTPGAGKKSKARGWTIVQENGSTRFLRVTSDGAIDSTITVNHPNGMLIRLDPAEPVIREPGVKKASNQIKISVCDLGSPSDVEYSGNAQCTWEDLGGFRVKVPSGEYSARLISVSYQGSVGPASVDGTRLMFVAAGVGPVAFTDDRDISAFLFFNDDTDHAGVLREVQRGE